MCKDHDIEIFSIKTHYNIKSRAKLICAKDAVSMFPNIDDEKWMSHCVCLKKDTLELLVRSFSSNNSYHYTGEICCDNTIDKYLLPKEYTEKEICDINIININTSNIIKLYLFGYIGNKSLNEKFLFAIRVLYDENFLASYLGESGLEPYQKEVFEEIKRVLDSAIEEKNVTEKYFVNKMKLATDSTFANNATFSAIKLALERYRDLSNGSMDDYYDKMGKTLYHIFDLKEYIPA